MVSLGDALPISLSDLSPSEAIIAAPVREVPVKELPSAPTPSAASQNSQLQSSTSPPQNLPQNLIDTLDTGIHLPIALIRFKVLVTVIQDVWVRYQCDDRAIRKFIIRAGNKLVLRGQHQIRFEVSHPSHAKAVLNHSKEIPLTEQKPFFTLPETSNLLPPLEPTPLPMHVPKKGG